MFAVVKIAGQQFKVEAGQKLYVPHLQGNTGDKVTFSDVLLVDNAGSVSIGGDVMVKVNAEILGERQGDKVIAFKMKRRKGFRKQSRFVDIAVLQEDHFFHGWDYGQKNATAGKVKSTHLR